MSLLSAVNGYLSVMTLKSGHCGVVVQGVTAGLLSTPTTAPVSKALWSYIGESIVRQNDNSLSKDVARCF